MSKERTGKMGCHAAKLNLPRRRYFLSVILNEFYDYIFVILFKANEWDMKRAMTPPVDESPISTNGTSLKYVDIYRLQKKKNDRFYYF